VPIHAISTPSRCSGGILHALEVAEPGGSASAACATLTPVPAASSTSHSGGMIRSPANELHSEAGAENRKRFPLCIPEICQRPILPRNLNSCAPTTKYAKTSHLRGGAPRANGCVSGGRGGGNPCRIQRAARCAHVFYSQMKSIYSKTRVKVMLISRKPWEGFLEGQNALRVKISTGFYLNFYFPDF